MFKRIIFICSLFIFLVFAFCSKNTGEDSVNSRILGIIHNQITAFKFGPLLKNLSENFIFRNYTSLETSVKTLKALTDSLTASCNGGDTSKLVAIQNAWKSAFYYLKILEIIQIGPSGSYSSIDSWAINYTTNPPSTTQIEATITGGAMSETTLSAKVDNENGFPAIEYLIYDNGAGVTTTSSICTALTGNRLSYLQAAVSLLSTRVTRITLNWNPTFSGNYTTILQTAGPSNEFYKAEKEAVDTLIKQIVTMIEKIKDDKIGYPAGYSVDSGGVVRATNVETRFSNISMLAISYNLTGINDFYTGNGGEGISDYVRYYNISLDNRIRAKIQETRNKANEILDLKSDLQNGSHKTVREFHTLTNELKILFTVELAGNLGSNFKPGLGDGDGD